MATLRSGFIMVMVFVVIGSLFIPAYADEDVIYPGGMAIPKFNNSEIGFMQAAEKFNSSEIGTMQVPNSTVPLPPNVTI